MNDHTRVGRGRRSRRAGLVLGVGMGGFIDGILLHQILGWHNMGSAPLPPATMAAMRRNMIWDGEFHAVVWLITLAGVYMLLASARRGDELPSPRAFSGQLLLGWGLFNVMEGIVDHHVLNIHHVRDLPTHLPAYDWAFLLVAGLGFVLLGWALVRSEAIPATSRDGSRERS